MNGGDVFGYESLRAVLEDAYDQAARGKGAQRHGVNKPFHEQPMQDLIRLNGLGFATGQISKKAQESLRLSPAARKQELLGVIVYAAGAIIASEAEAARAAASGAEPVPEPKTSGKGSARMRIKL